MKVDVQTDGEERTCQMREVRRYGEDHTALVSFKSTHKMNDQLDAVSGALGITKSELIRRCVDVGISVSRVGGHAQAPAMAKVAPKLRLDLAMFRELQDFARLGTELDPAAQLQLERGKRMVEILKQKQFAPMDLAEQVISIMAGSTNLLDDIEISAVAHFIDELLAWLKLEASEYLDQINSGGELSDELIESITDAIEAFKTIYKFSYGG